MIVRNNEKNFAENTIMSSEIGKYVCAYTDFGFKRLFFSEPNKDVLISFLNSFLNLKDKIVDMSYLYFPRLKFNDRPHSTAVVFFNNRLNTMREKFERKCSKINRLA